VVDDGAHSRSPQGPHIGDGEGAPGHVLAACLAVPGLLSQGPKLPGEFGDALAVHIPDDGHDQAPVRVHGHSDVVETLEKDFLRIRIQDRVEPGESLEGRRCGLEQEDREAEGSSRGFDLPLVLPAKGVQFGDVRRFLVADVGNLRP